jgi:hypothetical protein
MISNPARIATTAIRATVNREPAGSTLLLELINMKSQKPQRKRRYWW